MILLSLFLTFFQIGAFTFGGGYAMIPLIQSEVLARNWLTEETLINFIAVSESTPGPFAINIATYIGSELGGVLGSACATLGVVLPSFLIILLVARFFEKFKENPIVSGCMSGLKPAVIGLIGSAVLSIGQTVFFPTGVALSVLYELRTYVSLGIAILMTVLAFRKVHPIAIILISALLGILAGIWV
ncbi:MAG: chromate transporter [Clostridia bacterium]|nr:chromate transporter [Clostridia bacterium]MBQ2940984.1 chromate transporter [Clostridia bacterium]